MAGTQDNTSLWESKAGADVRLICENDEIPCKKEFLCHRNILANGNDYFHCAFFGPFAESNQGQMTLKEDNPDALEQFLRTRYGFPLGMAARAAATAGSATRSPCTSSPTSTRATTCAARSWATKTSPWALGSLFWDLVTSKAVGADAAADVLRPVYEAIAGPRDPPPLLRRRQGDVLARCGARRVPRGRAARPVPAGCAAGSRWGT